MPRTKLDKVFDNHFHDSDISEDFRVDFHGEEFLDTTEYANPLETIVTTKLMVDIDDIIAAKFSEFKKVKEQGGKRINKDNINGIYSYVKKSLPDTYTIVDIWYYLSVYFDINSSRFYECLRDEYKMELIDYLYNDTELLKKKNINNLF